MTGRIIIFLFVTFLFFPTQLTGISAHKLAGILLSVMSLPIIFSRQHPGSVVNRYSIAAAMVLIASWLGSAAFESLDTFHLQKMVLNLILLIVVLVNVRRENDFWIILLAIAVGGLATVYTGLTEITGARYERIEGVTGNPNGYGQVCVQTGIALFGLALLSNRLLVRLSAGGMILVCIYGLLYSASRGATMALAAVLVVLAGLRSTRGFGIVIAGLAAVLTIYLAPDTFWQRWSTTFKGGGQKEKSATEVRVELARSAWDVFREYPLAGVGSGNIVRAMLRKENVRHTGVSHNFMTQSLAETGILGTLFFCLLLTYSTRNFLRSARADMHSRKGAVYRSIFLALFVAVIFGQSSSGNYLHAIWYVIFGIAANINRLQQTEPTTA